MAAGRIRQPGQVAVPPFPPQLIGRRQRGLQQLFQLRQAFGLGALTMAAGIVVFLICTWRADLSRGTVRQAHTDIAEG